MKLYKYKIVYIYDPVTETTHGEQAVDYYLTDDKRYEAMAHACSTWGKAQGTQEIAQGAITADNNVALNTSQFQLPGQPTGQGFYDQHSGQFNASIQSLKPFFDTLMDELEVPRNP